MSKDLYPNELEKKFNQLKHYINLFLWVSSSLLIIAFLGLIIFKTMSRVLVDHAEGQIASLSWLFMDQNYPLYHPLDSPERYTLVYGPMLYLITGTFLKLLGAKIWVLKLPTSLALASSLGLMFAIGKKLTNLKIALFSTAYIVLAILCFGTIYGHLILQIRSDSIIIMLVALALFAVLQNNPKYSTLLLAVSFGVAVNLKVTSVFYFLPAYFLWWTQQGLILTLLSGFLGIGVAFLPFLHPNISLPNYILWIQEVSGHGVSPELVQENAKTGLYLLSPCLIVALHLWLENPRKFLQTFKGVKNYTYILLFSMIGTVVVAAKPGSGPHHLAPMIPPILYLFLQLLKTKKSIQYSPKLLAYSSSLRKAILVAFLYLLVLLIPLQNAAFKAILSTQWYQKPLYWIADDVEMILENYPGITIEMGYAAIEQYSFSYYRFLPVFAGNPLLLDGAALMDMGNSGLEIPDSTLEVLASCRTQIWLLPRGGEPFTLPNYYPPHSPLFREEFRQAFFQHYEPRMESEFFNLWFCKNNPE